MTNDFSEVELKSLDKYILQYASWFYLKPIDWFKSKVIVSLLHMIFAINYTALCYIIIHSGYPLIPVIISVIPLWVLAMIHGITSNRMIKMYSYFEQLSNKSSN